uniref:Ubx domain-containing n=1 Tax=Rhizophora mucronata TaxID=61149 RepID=A0A2P2KIK1_RHIMU
MLHQINWTSCGLIQRWQRPCQSTAYCCISLKEAMMPQIFLQYIHRNLCLLYQLLDIMGFNFGMVRDM